VKKRILFVFGTRPEAIKVAPVIKKFQNTNFEIKVCNTGQHSDLLDPVLSFFNIKPDFNLKVMKENQTLFDITSNILSSLKTTLETYKPDLVFVHGDTTTAFISSLACFYLKIKIAHIEAGLRTNDKYSPFPEEMNRTLISSLADFHFAPTKRSKSNLLDLKIPEQRIKITGNTVIDSLLMAKEIVLKDSNYQIKGVDNNKKIILFTGHRRENFGAGFEKIFKSLKKISKNYPDIQIVYPVHPNPNVKKLASKFFKNDKSILLIPPLDYGQFVWLMINSFIIITDSGGIQEEAPSLGKPVLVTRNKTERPEAVDAGTVILVGDDEDEIYKNASKLLSDRNVYDKMSKLINPYGDGNASSHIFSYVNKLF
jgi:UDP-N-acetylglucosamine 2-epimerase (non-hydrolysing)